MLPAPRLLALLMVVALASCVGPADDDFDFESDVATTDEWVGEIRKDNSGLTATMSLTRSTFGAADPVTVTLTFHNDSRSSVRLLRWLGPIAELEESLFSVTRDGQPVDYIGPHFKRARPDSEDYLYIPAGKSVSQSVVLSGAYDFAATGVYLVRYEVEELTVHTRWGRKSGKLRSNEVLLWIEGRSITGPEPVAGGEVIAQGAISYTQCDSTQQSTLVQAVSQATTYATGSLNYLSGTGSGTPRYVTWFGTYSSTRWATARSHFASIQDAFLNKNLGFNCKCKQKNVYAYVYTNQPYNIYLCGAFWAAPMSGTDSKGGTLIHEMSHFDVTAATDDWAYGQSSCKSLAISDPNKALNNADNHEYFAENTPALQ